MCSNPWKYHFYRRIRTTQERRLVKAANDWADEYGKVHVRGRRSKMPNSWDEFHHTRQKSWKKFRKTQYRDHGLRHDRNRHEMVVYEPPGGYWYDRSTYRAYTEHFDRMDVPYVVEPIRELYSRSYCPYRRQIYYYYQTVAWTIVWWADKDVGVDMIRPKSWRFWF